MTRAQELAFARSDALHILANSRAYPAAHVWECWVFIQSLTWSRK